MHLTKLGNDVYFPFTGETPERQILLQVTGAAGDLAGKEPRGLGSLASALPGHLNLLSGLKCRDFHSYRIPNGTTSV